MVLTTIECSGASQALAISASRAMAWAAVKMRASSVGVERLEARCGLAAASAAASTRGLGFLGNVLGSHGGEVDHLLALLGHGGGELVVTDLAAKLQSGELLGLGPLHYVESEASMGTEVRILRRIGPEGLEELPLGAQVRQPRKLGCVSAEDLLDGGGGG